jgi:small subunit ribosomal protein S7
MEEGTLQFNNVLLFGKYSMSEVAVRDGGLAKYINLKPTMVPHSDGRHANQWFGKTKLNIVERLINNMMRTEVFTGKKTKSYRVVKEAFEVIAERTKKNPVQVLVEALENAAPREEITRLQFGGISVPKAVDVAPSRRLDIAVRNIARGAVQASFKNTKPMELCLADEIILAAKGDMNSFAVAKKEEVERVAQSAR